MATKKDDAKSTGRGASSKAKGWSDDERAAMKERAAELKKESKRGKGSKAKDGERDLLEKVAELEDDDRAIAERLHAIVGEHAPSLSPRTWYGMPAYADGDGKVVCFFQGAKKFKTRYATLGFADAAKLDDGDMWPSAYAVAKLTPAVEKRIAALVKQAAG